MGVWEVRTAVGFIGNSNNSGLAMPLGTYGKEIVNLNVDSLWRGGPFESKVCIRFYSPYGQPADYLSRIKEETQTTPRQTLSLGSGSISSKTARGMSLLFWAGMSIMGLTRFSGI